MRHLSVTVSALALLGVSQAAMAQTVVSDANGNTNATVVSTVDGELITVPMGEVSTVDGAPAVLFANNLVTLDNNGTLITTGVTQTVQIADGTTGGVINNGPNGVLTGDSRVVQIDGDDATLNNSGLILGTGDQRNGTVYTNGTAQNFVLNNGNNGVIDAGAGNQGAGVSIETVATGTFHEIRNEGIIRGRGNAAAGSALAGDGIRIERERVDGSLANPSTGLFTGLIRNTGTITSEGANGTVAGVRIVDGVGFQGQLRNLGTISGVQNGVYFGNGDHTGGLFANSGTITSDSRAVNIDGTGLTFNNSGLVLGTGDQRNGTVYVDGTADDFTVNNSGTFDAGAGNQGSGFGVEIGGAEDGANTFTLINSGTIQGRGNAVASSGLAGDGVRIGNVGNTGIAEGTIINSGLIASEGANGTVAGLRVVNGVSFVGTLTNTSTGEISGVQNGVYFGEADHTGGVFNNAGLVSSDSRALNIDGTGLIINNTGEILGTGDQRNGTVYADSTAQGFVLNNDGLIDADFGNQGAGFSAELSADGNDFTIFNDVFGEIIGRGDAAAGSALAGDGIRLERSRVDGSLANPSTGLFTGTIINAGALTSEGANGTVGAFRSVDGVSFQGTLVNTETGFIEGIQNGVYFGQGDHTGGLFQNDGLVTSDSRVVNIDGIGLTVVNNGVLLGTGNQRNGTVYADGTADDFTFINDGILDAGAGNEGSGFGVEIGGAEDGANTFTLVNNGTIIGRGNASAATNAAGDGVRIGNVGNIGIAEANIVNTGLILSEGANGTVAGVRFVNGVSFSGQFDNSGTIIGTQNGVYFGNPVDGMGADHSNGVFNNLEGGLISSDSRAFNIDGFGLTVNNAGDILGTGNQRNGTVYADGTAQDYVFNNLATGVIDAGMGNEGSGFGAEIGADGNTYTLVNAGTIQGRGNASAATNGAGDGIRIGNVGNIGTANVSILNTGLIASEGANGTVAGVRFVNGISFAGVFDNAGTITGVQNGVYFGNPVMGEGADHSNGVFNNLAGGLISSDSRAFNIDGFGLTVNNAGDILGTGDQRNGTVYADGTADNFVFNNTGTIDAGAGNQGSGFGVEIGGAEDGANTFTLTNSGTIQGRGNASAGDNLAGDGIRIGNVGNIGIAEATITNTGLIASEGANGTVAGVRFVNGISFAGIFDNSGTITGVQNGVYFGNPVMGEGADHSNGVFNNLAGGLISSDSRAFNIDGLGLTVNNAGTILGTGNQRNGTVYADGTAQDYVFNNLLGGVIDAGIGNEGSGFGAEIGADGNTFTLVNDGTIQGRGNASAATNGAGDGIRIGNVGNVGTANVAITNTGLIASEGANGTVAGVRFVNGISFAGTFDNSGTITGVQNGVYFGNPVMGEGANHSNGVFNNLVGGLISSDSRAFNIDGFGLTVNNAGTILGTGDQRNGTVYADGTADDYVFNNTGTIDAGAGNQGSGFGVEIGGAVDGANTFTLTNSGTIQGRGNASAGDNLAGDGIRIGNVGNIGVAEATITNTGLIASEGANGTVAGVRFVNGISFAGTFDNSGTITGVQNGVYFGNPVMGLGADHSNGVFNNLAGGVISSDSRAFNIDGLGLTLNNAGSILGTGDQRNGTIYADGTADSFVINNLAGGVVDAGIGNNGSAVSLQLGDVDGDMRSITVNNAGTFAGRGDALPSGAAAGLRLFAGADNVTVTGDIINSGTISSETGAAFLIEGVNYIGTITNSGTISGPVAFDASGALGPIDFLQTGGLIQGDFIGSAFTDTLTINGGTFSANVLGDVNTTLGEGTVFVVGNRTIEGNLIANGDINATLGQDFLNIVGDLTFGENSTVTISTPALFSQTVIGEAITVIDQSGAFVDNGVEVTVLDNDFLIDYTVTLGSVTVTPVAADLSNVSTDANVNAFGAAVTSAVAANAFDATVGNALNTSGNVAGFNANTVDLLPAVNEGVSREIFEAQEIALAIIDRRLASETDSGLFAQVSARGVERDPESTSVTGYDGRTLGATVGGDFKVTENVRLGAAFSYANIELDQIGGPADITEIDTFQFTGYASFQTDSWFVNAKGGYTFGDGTSSRSGLTGPINAEFDVDAIDIAAKGGLEIDLNSVLSVRPTAGIRYANVGQDQFTETGGLNLTVAPDDVDFLDLSIGAEFVANFSGDGGFVRPLARVAYVYDALGDDRTSTASFVGGTPFTLTAGNVPTSRVEFGTGVEIELGNSVSIAIEYDGEVADGYSAHGGFARAKVTF